MMQEIGEEFDPQEPYTRRLSSILDEYPEGSQILREILQNSDDAKSTEQIFILDHNTYPSNHLIEPILSNYKKFDLKLDRYQGPALLSKNNSMFDERDLLSLKKLANSEKRDQFNKIGVMGIGFNSIYHITDSPSFITGDKLVILDPHRWYFNGGFQFNFVQKCLAEKFPDSFAPFRIPPFSITCDEPFKGTLFRYPLRNDTISDISKKTFKPNDILEIFRKFYENESVNCLLFLKYVERISFYELKEGAAEPELLYTIHLENADLIREQRRLLAENIVPMMDLLKSKKLSSNSQLESSYVAHFCRQKGNSKEDTVSWLILNYLNDLQETEDFFQKNFGKNIRNYKFIPNVGLAIPLNDLNVLGRLFCFLPFPIHMPFPVSVHGYFAYKNLVCLIAPTLDYDANNYDFLKILDQPDIKIVLKQLEICYNGLAKNQTPDELKIICNAIYEYLNKLFHRRNFRFMIKKELEHKPWIFYGNQFYTIDKIFTRLPNEFKDNGSLIELPLEYSVQFGSMFKAMGLQDEIGVNGLILIINNMNADDAEAKRFSVIIDERQYYDYNESLLSEEMNYWQGPAIWIYNDAEFPIKDFRALTNLGVGGKSHDDTKIGRFGTGFNCAYHITDLPSIVSGKYITFLDPNGKFLPEKGYPPKRHRGTRFNFIEKKFKKSFSDQCCPYKALEGLDFIDHCDFMDTFKGSLFRLPLRTRETVGKSEISSQLVEISDILRVLGKIQGNKEMLFLRNVEICSLHLLREQYQSPQLVWQAQINASRTCRGMRKSVTNEMQIYQLNIERINILNKKESEQWILCTGGHDRVKTKFEKFAREKRLNVT
ncbi:19313_t:CDS:2, partial [Funneliformis geosporum]